jgi:DNA-binding IclR family transcriptional regulator
MDTGQKPVQRSMSVVSATAARPDGRQGPRQGAQAIRRALAVLRILAAGRENGLPLREVVRATGLTRPTVHRIIHVLVEEGVVERIEGSDRFAVGRQVPELALARQTRSKLVIAAERPLAELSARIGDTVFLTTRTGLDTLCVARRVGGFPIQVLSIEVGARRPLGVSSAGVAILAAMPAREARAILERNATRFSSYKTTVAVILEQIAEARRRGYNLRDKGLVEGTRSISAWITARDGQALAAVTVSAIRRRLNHRRVVEVAEAAMHAARSIERAL